MDSELCGRIIKYVSVPSISNLFPLYAAICRLKIFISRVNRTLYFLVSQNENFHLNFKYEMLLEMEKFYQEQR